MTDHHPPTALNPYSMLGLVVSRFRESFGDVEMTLDHSYQWSLKTAPFARDIFVLTYGPENKPVVWIFDPNDRNDGVSRSLVEHEDGIIEVVDHIRERVQRASRTRARRPSAEHEPEDQDDMTGE